jgi:hypothetical protein
MRVAVRAVVLVVALVIGTSACSSSKSEICKDSEELSSSIDDLKDVNVVQDGVPALTSAAQNVKSDATELAAQAKGEFGPQVKGVTDSLATLDAAIDGARGQGVAALQPVLAASGVVQSAVQTLVSDVNNAKC